MTGFDQQTKTRFGCRERLIIDSELTNQIAVSSRDSFNLETELVLAPRFLRAR